MKLEVRHFYPCTPEQYWAMYWDEAFDARLMEDSTVQREVLEEKQVDGLLHRRLRFTPNAELPGPIAALVGSSKLIYDQANVFDRANNLLTWEVLPTFISADKFTAGGRFQIQEHPEGCALKIDGEIQVKVRFIGGRIEAQVVSQIEDAYANMKRVSDVWLAEKKCS